MLHKPKTDRRVFLPPGEFSPNVIIKVKVCCVVEWKLRELPVDLNIPRNPTKKSRGLSPTPSLGSSVEPPFCWKF